MIEVFQTDIENFLNYKDINLLKEHIVDVTECPVHRCKDYEIQKNYYSSKKKKHTIKIQIIAEEDTNKIVGVSFDVGCVHDFNIFKKTTKELDKNLMFLKDLGYLGIDKLFKNSLIPKKKSKLSELSSTDKELNKLISSNRISYDMI